jgi:hypothetical protein
LIGFKSEINFSIAADFKKLKRRGRQPKLYRTLPADLRLTEYFQSATAKSIQSATAKTLTTTHQTLTQVMTLTHVRFYSK